VDKANELSRVSKSFYDGDIEEVDILEGYLVRVLATFDSYCGEVNKAICTVSPQVPSESQTNETH
jgi:hypothetical protein